MYSIFSGKLAYFLKERDEILRGRIFHERTSCCREREADIFLEMILLPSFMQREQPPHEILDEMSAHSR